MKNIRNEISIWVQLGAFVIIWVAVLFFTGTSLELGWQAFKKFPTAVTIYVFAALVFTQWAWRFRVFKGWLVPFPDLQGTWQGTLQSTWEDPETGQAIPAIPVTLAIKQTFSHISCVLYTDESSSHSTAAQIFQDDESGVFRLSYNYTNRSRAIVRDRSAIHDGAANLRVVLKPDKRLEGEYWTSRKSTGDLTVSFVSKKIAQRFLEVGL